MSAQTWLKQSSDQLFEQLEWDKPERKTHAGKLLILGGHIHALTAPAKSYQLAESLGIGQQKVCLPSKAKSMLGEVPFDAVFLPSTTSGEFSKDGLGELLQYSQWADTVLLPGDIGRNSQTTMLIDELVRSYGGQIVITKDALDLLSSDPRLLLNRNKTTIVASIAQLQKLVKNINFDQPIIFNMDLTKLVDLMSNLSKSYNCSFVTLHQNQFLVAHDGKLSTTKRATEPTDAVSWRNSFATHAAVYQTWYPNKPFESLTNCAFLLK